MLVACDLLVIVMASVLFYDLYPLLREADGFKTCYVWVLALSSFELGSKWDSGFSPHGRGFDTEPLRVGFPMIPNLYYSALSLSPLTLTLYFRYVSNGKGQ